MTYETGSPRVTRVGDDVMSTAIWVAPRTDASLDSSRLRLTMKLVPLRSTRRLDAITETLLGRVYSSSPPLSLAGAESGADAHRAGRESHGGASRSTS
jgi:hypothetical protein